MIDFKKQELQMALSKLVALMSLIKKNKASVSQPNIKFPFLVVSHSSSAESKVAYH